jgi:phage recombination protein Bet
VSNIARIQPTAGGLTPQQIALARRTVAKDCNEDEFNLFLYTAQHLRLDPLRRQIFAFVYSKDQPDKRKMTIVTGIDGFRSIAARTGDYRPDDEEPTYEINADLKSPTNPLGLVKATVRVYKFSHSDWHKVTASAYWDEYAPIKTEGSEGFEWVETDEVWPDSGKPKKRKVPKGDVKQVLDTSGNWGRMPRLMLAKVAEALALRKAWPDDFANVYAQEEVDKLSTEDLTPAEIAQMAATEDRLAKIRAGQSVLIDWMDNNPLCAVPIGQLVDKVFAFIRSNKEEPSAIGAWADRNRFALREFWARAPGDALDVKKAIEGATKNLNNLTDAERTELEQSPINAG